MNDRQKNMAPLLPEDIFLFRRYLKAELEHVFETEACPVLVPFPSGRIDRNKAPDKNRNPLDPKNSPDSSPKPLSFMTGASVDSKGYVLLPLKWRNTLLGTIKLQKAGEILDRPAPHYWVKILDLILEKMEILKNCMTDRETGCLDLTCFREFLPDLMEEDGLESPPDLAVIFVGISRRNPVPALNRPEQLWTGIMPTLRDCLSEALPFYVFRPERTFLAIVFPHDGHGRVRQAGLRVMAALGKNNSPGRQSRNPKFVFAITTDAPSCIGPEIPRSEWPNELLNMGRKALALAETRPVCPISFLTELKQEDSKLVLGAEHSLEGLRPKWNRRPLFSLALSRFDSGNREDWDSGLKEIRSSLHPEEELIPCTDDSFFCYFPGAAPEQALKRCRSVQNAARRAGRTVSMGLAYYPHMGFRKEDVPTNACKALAHTSYFGPDTVTSFDSVSLNISGDGLFNTGHVRAALAEYRRGMLLNPSDTNLLNSLGVCYAELRWYKRAIRCFERTLALDKSDIMARYNLASVYTKLGMPDKALYSLEEAAALNGDHFEVLFQLGRLLQERTKWPEALECFQKAAVCSDRKNFIHRYLGESWLALEKGENALAEFKKAVKLNPSDALSLSRLGVLYAEIRSDFEVAQALCRKSLELESNNSLHWKALGWICFLKGDYQTAIDCLKEAKGLFARDHEIHYRMGLAYEKMYKLKEAERSWKKAIGLSPSFHAAKAALDSMHGLTAGKPEMPADSYVTPAPFSR